MSKKQIKKYNTKRLCKLHGKTQAEYHLLHDELLRIQRKNDEILINCIVKKNARENGKVEYLTLDPNEINNEHGGTNIPFKEKYLIPSLEKVYIQPYCSDSNESLDHLHHLKDNNHEAKPKLFLLPDYIIRKIDKSNNNIMNIDQAKLQEIFIDHLLGEQEKKINELIERKVIIKKLKDIPFQMYLSIPKKQDNNNNKKGKGVFMFVNRYTLSGVNYVSAFKTDNEEVLNTFDIIFEAVKNDKELKANHNSDNSSVCLDNEKLEPSKSALEWLNNFYSKISK